MFMTEIKSNTERGFRNAFQAAPASVIDLLFANGTAMMRTMNHRALSG